MQLDSTDVTAADRQHMAQAVWQNREKFDGFVLTHGTDTLAYTAALLTHLLPHFDKPLVLTGSMLPMGVPDSDAPRNLLEELEARLRGRHTETEDAIQKRLASIKLEIENSKKFDYQVINDTVENAVVNLEKIML